VPEKVWVNDVGNVSGEYVDARIEIELPKPIKMIK